MVPIPYLRRPWDLLEALAHEVSYIMQRLHYEYEEEFTYLLACGEALRVQLAELEAGEELLGGRGRVAVRR